MVVSSQGLVGSGVVGPLVMLAYAFAGVGLDADSSTYGRE